MCYLSCHTGDLSELIKNLHFCAYLDENNNLSGCKSLHAGRCWWLEFYVLLPSCERFMNHADKQWIINPAVPVIVWRTEAKFQIFEAHVGSRHSDIERHYYGAKFCSIIAVVLCQWYRRAGISTGSQNEIEFQKVQKGKLSWFIWACDAVQIIFWELCL